MKVYLTGVITGSNWHEEMVKNLQIDYFIPQEHDLSEEKLKHIQSERNNADYLLYVITPKMTDMFVISEIVDESNKRPGKLIFCFLPSDNDMEFNKHQVKSLNATGKMVKANGAYWFESLDEVTNFLNNKKE